MRPVLCRRLLILSLLSLMLMPASAAADRIEAVQGKQYNLTKQHGPWMIMAASWEGLLIVQAYCQMRGTACGIGISAAAQVHAG